MERLHLPAPFSVRYGPGIYVHIPFCLSKCPYCAFASQVFEPGLAEAYLAALLIQIKTMAGHPWVATQRFSSLFLGGGTPTVYEGPALALLVETCLRSFRFVDVPEVTVETNPNTVTLEKLSILRKSGVTRLSIGAQSFDDRMLAALGRSHTALEARSAVDLARRAGFESLNIDLMYGLPEQTARLWSKTLTEALTLNLEHLAVYELTLEESTPFGSRSAHSLRLPDEDLIVRMTAEAHDRMLWCGYDHYEIANFCRPGYACRHNLCYWHNLSYLGLGAGAVSCFSGLRVKSHPAPRVFIDRIRQGQTAFAEGECLMREGRFRETLVLGLRLQRGVDVRSLRDRLGLDLRQYYGEALSRLLAEDLLAIGEGRLYLTPKGRLLANQVMAQLV